MTGPGRRYRVGVTLTDGVPDERSDPGPAPELAAEIDTSVPHSARIWNYWLGGTDNYPVDRAAGDQYREVYPQIIDVARTSRAFQARAVRFLAAEIGLRQFLDVGAGLPTADNTHQIAQTWPSRAWSGSPAGILTWASPARTPTWSAASRASRRAPDQPRWRLSPGPGGAAAG